MNCVNYTTTLDEGAGQVNPTIRRYLTSDIDVFPFVAGRESFTAKHAFANSLICHLRLSGNNGLCKFGALGVSQEKCETDLDVGDSVFAARCLCRAG